MPLDIPREDDFDDSLPDISGYEVMNIDANNDLNGDHDSDFSFSSDEEEQNGEGADNNQERYANYELIGQGNNEIPDNIHNRQALHSEDDEEEEENAPTDRFYQHNYVVQWIETDEPLFDREQFEAQQARQRQTHGSNQNQMNNNNNNQSNESPRDVDSNQVQETVEEPTTSQLIPDTQTNCQKESTEVKLDTEKIDIIKGLMSNFKLPDESYPGWAKELSEDQWKNFLTTKFHEKTPNKNKTS